MWNFGASFIEEGAFSNFMRSLQEAEIVTRPPLESNTPLIVYSNNRRSAFAPHPPTSWPITGSFPDAACQSSRAAAEQIRACTTNCSIMSGATHLAAQRASLGPTGAATPSLTWQPPGLVALECESPEKRAAMMMDALLWSPLRPAYLHRCPGTLI